MCTFSFFIERNNLGFILKWGKKTRLIRLKMFTIEIKITEVIVVANAVRFNLFQRRMDYPTCPW